jgi:hypothetical protein
LNFHKTNGGAYFRPDALPEIFTTLGLDYDDRVLPSITNEVLKAVVAQFDAGELITQREMVTRPGFRKTCLALKAKLSSGTGKAWSRLGRLPTEICIISSQKRASLDLNLQVPEQNLL